MWDGVKYECLRDIDANPGISNYLDPSESSWWMIHMPPDYSAHDVGDNKDTIQMELPDRAQQHGDWIANSRVYDDLCNILLGKIKMQEIPGDVIGLHIEEASARSAVSMIAMKLARIATGNIQEPDHWLDIAGYARLHYDLLMKGKDNGHSS